MYAKIQKDMSSNYIIIESNNIELSFSTIKSNYEDYVRNFLSCLLCYDEEINIRHSIGKQLQEIFGVCDWSSVKAVTNWWLGDCKEAPLDINCNCDIKGIKVNGTCYVTCGNIYLMNDKGQTIQKV